MKMFEYRLYPNKAQQKLLSVRTHVCPCCGYVADRDVNAAKNILLQARAWPSGTASGGSPVELRSPRL